MHGSQHLRSAEIAEMVAPWTELISLSEQVPYQMPRPPTAGRGPAHLPDYEAVATG